jgi:hypothetical protein
MKGHLWFFCVEHRSLKLFGRSVAVIGLVSGIVTLLGWYSITPSDVWRVIYSPNTSLMDVVESAAVEGVKYAKPSSENVVAKVMTRAALDDASAITERYFLFSLVSPFKPFAMDTIFRGDECRFVGKGKRLSDDKSYGFIDITGISCVDDRGLAYELHAPVTGRLGFVTNAGDLASESVNVVLDGEDHTLRQSDNVLIRFDLPVVALTEIGRTR